MRRASDGLKLKAIHETGELREPALMRRAAHIALDAGADFLKTSTGKTPVSTTPQAAEVLLHTIGDDARTGSLVGFKASGGVRTVAEAAVYIGLVESVLGASALALVRFRIGASSLLGDIEGVLSGSAPAVKAATDY